MIEIDRSVAPPGSDDPYAISDGDLMTAADILKSSLQHNKSITKSLFRNTRLFVAITSADGVIGVRNELAYCNNLDLFNVEGDLFPEKASCDGVLFGYSANAAGVSVDKESTPVKVLPLDAGTYSLNGVPFLVKD